MSKAREKRLRTTGKWFQKTTNKNLWVNNIFPILLIISFVVYLITI